MRLPPLSRLALPPRILLTSALEAIPPSVVPNGVVGMPFRTLLFLAVRRADLAPSDVLLDRYGFKMRRVDARSVTTEMVERQKRELTVLEQPSDSVSERRSEHGCGETPIPMRIDARLPQPALARFGNGDVPPEACNSPLSLAFGISDVGDWRILHTPIACIILNEHLDDLRAIARGRRFDIRALQRDRLIGRRAERAAGGVR